MATSKFDQMTSVLEGDVVDDETATYEEENGSNAVAVYSDQPDIDVSEIRMPRLKLLQQMSPAVTEEGSQAKMGQWLIDGHDPVDEVIIVPIKFARGRALYQEDGGDRELTCSSPDAKLGIGKYGPGSKENPTGQCSAHGNRKDPVCPMAKWGAKNPKTGKSSPPPCDFYYEYVVWSQTHETFTQLRLQKTSMEAAEYLNGFIANKGLGKFAVSLSSTRQSGKGSYAVAKVKLVQMPEEARLQLASGQ